MRPDDDVRLLHLREAAATALRCTEGRTRSDLDDDEWAAIRRAADIVESRTRLDAPALAVTR